MRRAAAVSAAGVATWTTSTLAMKVRMRLRRATRGARISAILVASPATATQTVTAAAGFSLTPGAATTFGGSLARRRREQHDDHRGSELTDLPGAWRLDRGGDGESEWCGEPAGSELWGDGVAGGDFPGRSSSAGTLTSGNDGSEQRGSLWCR